MSEIVGSSGPVNADIIFIGEAPGAEEVKAGEPFVGSSGRLLRSIAGNVRIIPHNVYMTNVVKERPKDNKIEVFISLDKSIPHRTPAYDLYEKALLEELNALDGRIIVAFGNVALYALTGHKGITTYRGSMLKSDRVPGKWIVPVIHPSAALRSPSLVQFITYDLAHVYSLSKQNIIEYKQRELILNPNYLQVSNYLDHIDINLPLAFDIEILNKQITHISLAQTEKKAISICFYSPGDTRFSTVEEEDIMFRLAVLLQDKNIVKLAHNASFDSVFLYEHYKIITRNIWDTMIAHAILYPDLPKNLAAVSSIHTDIPYYKDEGKTRFKHGTFSSGSYMQTYLQSIGCFVEEMNAELFDAYSALDAITLPEIYKLQYKLSEKKGNLDAILRQNSIIEPIIYMSEHGISVNKESMSESRAEITKELNALQSALDSMVGDSFNVNSIPQIREYFYSQKKARPITKNGTVTVNENALRKLSGRGFQEARLILEIRKKRNIKSRYLNVKLDDRGRFRSSWNPVGGEFGRLSSSKDLFGRGSNIENLPPQMRYYLKPDNNYTAYELDLSNAENRIVAYLGNEEKMIYAFENGINIHTKTASLMFRISIDEVTELHNEWLNEGQPQSDKYCPEISGYRYDFYSWGKNANELLNYGKGPGQASVSWECTLKEARKIINSYFEVYPGLARYHSLVESKLREDGYLENLFGRRYIFHIYHSQDVKKGYSFCPKSTVADQINKYGVLVSYKHPKSELLAQIKDGVLIQISNQLPIEDHIKTLLYISGEMETPLTSWTGKDFTIPVDINVFSHNLRDGLQFSRADLEKLQSYLQHARKNAA